MRILTSPIAAALLLIASAMPGPAGATGETPASQATLEINRMYAAQDAGMANLNVAQVFTGCSPSYFAASSGPRNREDITELKSDFTGIFRFTRAARQITSVKSIEVRGRDAVAMVTRQVAIQTVKASTGRTYLFQASEVDQDNWSRTPSGWLETSKTTLKERETMDGKPFNPSFKP